MIFVAYELNLPLNMEKPHYHSQRAGEWSLIWAHDSRPIYHALTYIAVPLLGPHQPRYIGLTLYKGKKVSWQSYHYNGNPCTWSLYIGPWFNIKMSSYQYRKSHCGDKTVVRSSYLHNGISYTGKMTSLYWFSPLVPNLTLCVVCFQVLQLYQIAHIHHGLMMVGPSGSGKSTAWRVLLKALERLEGVEGVAHVIDPKVSLQLRNSLLEGRAN